MVVLSRKFEEHDVLQSLAAGRRELHLAIHTEEALRRPRSRAQRLHLAPVFASAREQLAAQLLEQRRVAFRESVAAELFLSVPKDSDQAELPRLIKSYVDILKRHVLPDDSVIDHLLVSLDRSSPAGAHARYRVMPLDLFSADWDRAFRVARPRPGSAEEWGPRAFTDFDREMLRENERVLAIVEMLDDQEQEQLAEDPDALVDLDIPSTFEEFADWEVRASVRKRFEPQVARDRADWFVDHAFHTSDRPGPPPSWLTEVAALNVADIQPTAPSGPGEVTVAAPPTSPRPEGAPSWELSTRQAWARSRANFLTLDFGGPLALDVAIRGGAVSSVDVDNAAGRMIRAFDAMFADTNADVRGVRVYRQDGPREDVRVRVLGLSRLLALADHVHGARQVIRAQRGERRRAAPAPLPA